MTTRKEHSHTKPEVVTPLGLRPGDVIERKSGLYTFIMQTACPLFPGNQLTLWRSHSTNELRLDSVKITANVGTRFKLPTEFSLKWAAGIS